MAQDAFPARPIGNEAPSATPDPQATDNPRLRRRLGGWQEPAEQLTAGIGGDLATAPLDVAPAIPSPGQPGRPPDGWFDGPATAPLPATGAPRFTAPAAGTAGAGVAATAPMTRLTPGHAFAAPTAPIARTTAPIDRAAATTGTAQAPAAPDAGATAPMPAETGPFVAQTTPMRGPGPVNRVPEPGDPTVSLPRLTQTAGTAPVRSEAIERLVAAGKAAASTMPVASQTAEIENVTAGIGPGRATAPIRQTAPAASDQALSPELQAEIERLRARARTNPNDSDALFELSVALHRNGLRAEAREALTKLVALYEQRGQLQQAARINGMLGVPKTGPIGSQVLPPRPVDTSATIPFSSATTPLHAPTGALQRVKERSKPKGEGSAPAFAPDALVFTMPLPGENELPDDARELLKQSEAELEARHLAAAIDTCVQVIALVPDYAPVFLRLAEIYTRQRLHRRARAQAEALIRLADASGQTDNLWMVYRVLLHASESDETSLRRLVELLIDAGQSEQASFYASRLIQLLDAEGLADQALQYSIRLGEIIPGDTRAALENVILRVKAGDRGGALDRWESAVRAGADPVIARASIAALTSSVNEDDHWRLLSAVAPAARSSGNRLIVDAYTRTAAALPETPSLIAGRGLLMAALNDAEAREFLARAAGARTGSPFARAASAVALAWSFDGQRVDEYVAAVRTALKLLSEEGVASHPAWQGLTGRLPRMEDLSLELGEALLARSDAAGAAEVLKEAHARTRHHGSICERLAEAYFRIGQLGSALTVLDELAVHYRSIGQLEAMAGVLRHMSQLAPNNIKVKSRLIDAYLQRGFVAEARAELIQRADLEERSGLIKDAMTSLQRAADLSWTIGLAEETFSLYNRVIDMSPDDVGNRTALVNFYLQMGRLSDAAEHQRAVVDIALRGDNKHEAVAALHQVIGLTPDDTNAYYQLAELLGTMGEYHQAERVYRRLVLMNPDDAIAQAKATAMAALRESAGR